MTWKDDVLLHAKEELDKEVCGLLVNIRGKLKYKRCKNLAHIPSEQFILDPLDWARIEDEEGEIEAVVHSHPFTPPEASQADMISAEKMNIKWWICNPKTEQWGFYEPKGYKADLISRPWVWGVTDCWSLVREYYSTIEINLKDFERPNNPDEFLANPLFDRYWQEAGFRELRHDEQLQENDSLLMSIFSTGLNHMAVYLGGEKNEILHHLQGRLSSKEPYNEYYQKVTGRRLRYVA